MRVSVMPKVQRVLSLGILMVFTGVSRADTVFVWNTNGSIVKFDTNGVGTVLPVNLISHNFGPVGLAVDNDGNLFAGVPDGSALFKFDTNGSAAQIATEDTISGIAFDHDGTPYGIYPWYYSVSRLTPQFHSFGQPQTQVGLGYPLNIAFNASGTMFVANHFRPPFLLFPGDPPGNATNTIHKFSPTLSDLGPLAAGLNGPWGLAFDRQGNLFASVSGDSTILKFKFGRFVVTSVFADSTSSGLSSPKGIAFDSLGNLFVANSGDGTILKLATNGQATIFATNLLSPTAIAVYPGLKL